MKDMPWNRLRLFLHCLFHLHRDCLTSGGYDPTIGCYDCDYEHDK